MKTFHSPEGAIALIAVIKGEKIHNLGFTYPFIPETLGGINNLPRHRKFSHIGIKF
jgi:CBS-domain-containing membrane protein